MRRRIARLAVVLLALLGSGCVTMTETRRGVPPAPESLASLERGVSTLAEVLDALGAPLEVYQHTDGRLLVYRYRVRRSFRLGIQPSMALRFVDASQVASEALGNLSFTYETYHQDEDRVTVLIDDDGVLQGIGIRRAAAGVPPL